jgi:hypothetical protein
MGLSILAAVPANVDFHNSQIIQEAKRVDPTTRRTIHVITKPDLIDPGAEEGVIDLLLGKKMDSLLGFHVVKGRGQKDLLNKVSLQKGLKTEEAFFSTTMPWKDLAESDRGLLGTANLRKKLATIQTEILKASIPDIKSEIFAKRAKAADQLFRLGKSVDKDDRKRIVFSECCNQLMKIMESNIRGRIQDGQTSWCTVDGYTLRSKLESLKGKFGDSILTSKLKRYGGMQVGTEVNAFIDGHCLKSSICAIAVNPDQTRIYSVECQLYRVYDAGSIKVNGIYIKSKDIDGNSSFVKGLNSPSNNPLTLYCSRNTW